MGNWSYGGGFSGTGASGARGGSGGSSGGGGGRSPFATPMTGMQRGTPFDFDFNTGGGGGRALRVPTTIADQRPDVEAGRREGFTPEVWDNFTRTTSPGATLGSSAGTDIGTGLMNSYQTAMDVMEATAAAERARSDTEYASILGRIDQSKEGTALKTADLNNNYGFDAATLDNKSSGINLDRASLDIEMQKAGIGRRQNESERDYINRMKDFARSLTDQNRASITFEGQDKARSIKSGYTTGGTLFAPGHRYDQNANALRTAADLNREQIGYDKTIAGLDRDYQSTLYDDERIGLSEADSRIAAQRLDLMANQLGIDRARLTANLENGLAQLGLSGRISVDELVMQAMNNRYGASNDYADILSTVISLAIPMGDLYGAFLPPSVPLYPNDGGSSGGTLKHF